MLSALSKIQVVYFMLEQAIFIKSIVKLTSFVRTENLAFKDQDVTLLRRSQPFLFKSKH